MTTKKREKSHVYILIFTSLKILYTAIEPKNVNLFTIEHGNVLWEKEFPLSNYITSLSLNGTAKVTTDIIWKQVRLIKLMGKQ